LRFVIANFGISVAAIVIRVHFRAVLAMAGVPATTTLACSKDFQLAITKYQIANSPFDSARSICSPYRHGTS
jgi:hypothetical protein